MVADRRRAWDQQTGRVETHGRWIEDQAEQHRRTGYEGMDEHDAAAARALAGPLVQDVTYGIDGSR